MASQQKREGLERTASHRVHVHKGTGAPDYPVCKNDLFDGGREEGADENVMEALAGTADWSYAALMAVPREVSHLD